ncbi:MAG: hypothetical protein D6681_19470 [Calditrichaeota bacterium]|nr:MAG: hypothetical protein D6681_19470 [Calditrichota bacterium]
MAGQSVARSYLALSREFEEQQLYRKAEEALRLGLEKLPHHPLLLTRLAVFYYRLDMLDEALEAAHRLIEQHGDLRFPYFLRGNFYRATGNPEAAIQDYEKALTGNVRDRGILRRLIPLLLEQREAEKALEIIRTYQSRLNKPVLFAEWEAEALLQLDRRSAAFTKMREALLQSPGNARLVKRYLQFSIQTGQRHPAEIYEVLRLGMPGLVPLSDEELSDVEVDFFISQGQFEAAQEIIARMLETEPDSYYWRRRQAFLKLEMGMVEESAGEFKALLQEDCTDVEVRKVLENYHVLVGKLDEWKRFIQNMLRDHPDQLHLFEYLRRIQEDTDWLAIAELDYEGFLEQVEGLELTQADLTDVTYQKLPAYALEAFTARLAIGNEVPTPQTLWHLLYSERMKKDQIPPFHEEDLEAAYPVWLFALHIYFLFRTYGELPVAFIPAFLQHQQVAALVNTDRGMIHINISSLLHAQVSPEENLMKVNQHFKWQWSPQQGQPERMVNGIPFYSPEQFQEFLEQLQGVLSGE